MNVTAVVAFVVSYLLVALSIGGFVFLTTDTSHQRDKDVQWCVLHGYTPVMLKRMICVDKDTRGVFLPPQ